MSGWRLVLVALAAGLAMAGATALVIDLLIWLFRD